ncbi:MAG TPA: hypothetical protein VJU86_05790 [Pyrinomonadaceae bacterium]|nr:hypothetical protein [Pyrinomonadaceae bacterium]
MDSENKRIEIEDLPRAEEELTDDEAKNVEGGAGFMYFKDAPIVGEVKVNTVGGSLSADKPKP